MYPFLCLIGIWGFRWSFSLIYSPVKLMEVLTSIIVGLLDQAFF